MEAGQVRRQHPRQQLRTKLRSDHPKTQVIRCNLRRETQPTFDEQDDEPGQPVPKAASVRVSDGTVKSFVCVCVSSRL